MSHETNTYSPVVTDLQRFNPLYGDEVRSAFEGTKTGIGGFIELAVKCGARIVTPFAGSAPPSGPVQTSAYEAICKVILDCVEAEIPDGIMLCLHGAMVTEDHEDGEGELLRRIRAIAPTTPIAITLDMHCNMYEAIAQHSNTLAGYFTYPHEDMYETAIRSGRALIDWMSGKTGKPIMNLSTLERP
eukprot:gnl/MRDRNA2_/MRDRNA2_81152_c0_seq3.p2 gnl/MRDRNA2_/MRDRNA2_81152_c0~~gnl/MRDRNA2_/MRDRNA2_81152_c0_seq3.p2  ORF type:complete len:204 (-),score=31.29 gnl/MRDRNA2_/MRDRNA2_81152_c0_seq3:679-1239(-)